MVRTGILSLIFLVVFLASSSQALDRGAGRTPCYLDRSKNSCASQSRPSGPECGVELTCAGRPAQLGFSHGICFRASCPGVWGLLHERLDQASFRRRLIRYRHYALRGSWELKDEGVIESAPVQQRALFLVLPDDLLEFKLLEPDPHAKVAVQELGYVKKGTVAELQKWLAHRIYQEGGLPKPISEQ